MGSRFLHSILAWLVLSAALAGCSSLPQQDFDRPVIELLSLRPIAADAMEARFEIKLRVLNPNDFALDVEGLYFEVFLRDRQVLSGVSSRPTRIAAFGEGVLTVEAGIGMLNSIRLIRELAEEPSREGLPYRLKTKLSLGNIPTAVRIEQAGVLHP